MSKYTELANSLLVLDMASPYPIQEVREAAAILRSMGSAEPVACLIRYRGCTPARMAHDGRAHWHDWSEWEIATLAHGKVVTDPSRNPTEDDEWQMKPLYATPQAQPAPVPDGWVMVPREPSSNSLHAGVNIDVGDQIGCLTWDECKTLYRAMLAAEIGRAMS